MIHEQEKSLYAKDIARLTGRSVEWARAAMNNLEFGELLKPNSRLMSVTEEGFIAWKRRSTRVVVGAAGAMRIVAGSTRRADA
jgi:hypothetical protein